MGTKTNGMKIESVNHSAASAQLLLSDGRERASETFASIFFQFDRSVRAIGIE
jgi:hypothetical protein